MFAKSYRERRIRSKETLRESRTKPYKQMKKIFLISILISFCAVTASDPAYAEDVTTKIPPKVISKSEDELRLSMRTLWESRAILLRAYIISAMNDSEDADEARDKLLKNAGDLGGSIRPYYGGLASKWLWI